MWTYVFAIGDPGCHPKNFSRTEVETWGFWATAVARECRKLCGFTGFVIPAREAARSSNLKTYR